MNNTVENALENTAEVLIGRAEQRLLHAILQSDVAVLDELLADDLIFTNHLGHVMSKQDDLGAHRSGVLKVNQLVASEQRIQWHGEVAIVSVRMALSGTFAGNPSDVDLRFTRIWSAASNGAWQVIAAHSCGVV